ncbi:MAG TPA: phosphocholine cytidylyltransferase family protein [Ignavibacteria bacterium]|nr:phosphocholine cytidylyltransferase family protein [Ignavibacteria bacterium]
MQAVILAAGIGGRLKPLTEDLPKCLLKIGDTNILQITIDNLIDNGIEEFIMVTGYREELIKNYIAYNFTKLKVRYVTNEDYAKTNSAYGLCLAKDLIRDEDIYLLDADILFESDVIRKLNNSHLENPAAVNITSDLNNEMVKVACDMDNRITKIGKNIDLAGAIGEATGIYRLSSYYMQNLFGILSKDMENPANRNEPHEVYLQKMADTNEKRNSQHAIDVSDCICIEIDTEEDYEQAKKLWNEKK